MTAPPSSLDARAQLVQANRILADQGVVDAFGHVSVRDPDRRHAFLLSCNRAPASVRSEDIVRYGLDAEPMPETARRPVLQHYRERFIHAEIYRARDDVVAVVHSHSPSVIPFGVTKSQLRPVFHMAGFLGSGSAHFDIADEHGDTDMLISNPTLGRALARSFAGCDCVLMRGHGSTVVGGSLPQAVYRAVYAEVNAKLQLQAAALGNVKFLSAAEAALASRTLDGQIDRAWALWAEKAGGVEPG